MFFLFFLIVFQNFEFTFFFNGTPYFRRLQLHSFIPTHSYPPSGVVLHWVCACFLISFQLLYEEVLSHSSPLETIATKGSNMAEHYTTQQEVQQLQCRYNALKEKAKVLTVQTTYGFIFFLCRHLNNKWLFWEYFSEHMLFHKSQFYSPKLLESVTCVLNILVTSLIIILNSLHMFHFLVHKRQRHYLQLQNTLHTSLLLIYYVNMQFSRSVSNNWSQ